MRFLLVALVASSYLLAQINGSAIPSSDHLPRMPRDLRSRGHTWRIADQDQDHITYVRSPVGSPVSSPGSRTGQSLASTAADLTITVPEVDCNKTTTTPAPIPRRSRPVDSVVSSGDVSHRGSSAGGRRGQPELRSRSSIHSTAGRGVEAASVTESRTQTQTSETHPHEGNYFWMVSHRSDDHITYRRRSNDTGRSSQGTEDLAQGELRQIGSGSDTVSARVVDTKTEESVSTEEGLLSHNSRKDKKHQSSGGSHLTNDLVHPYATRNHTKSHSSSRRTGTTRSGAESTSHSRQSQLEVRSGAPTGGRVNIFKSRQAASTFNQAQVESDDTDTSYPNVGDEVDGWRVVSKNKEHISWERVVPTLTATSAPSSLQLKSLDSDVQFESDEISGRGSSRRGGSSRRWKPEHSTSRHQSQHGRRGKGKSGRLSESSSASAAEEAGEGFPVVFETYSRATFENEDVNLRGTIRTSLSNTSNWQVGDELSGWKVISKDANGITWEKIKTEGAGGLQLKSGGSLSDSDYDDDNGLNEEDLLAQRNNQRAGDDDSESFKGPPGSWYLSKETKNSITWSRDQVPDDVIFDMNEYPRIGDNQSGWQVSDKSKNHISWKRLGTSDSDEELVA